MQPKDWALVAVPLVVAIANYFLGRRLRNAETQRSAQTAVLNQIQGSVGDHGSRLVALETRVDGHEVQIGRLTTGMLFRPERDRSRREDQ